MSEVNLGELKAFLLKANMPHANGTAEVVNEPDGSRTIEFSDGDWHMHDNFFGGEPYGGRMIVHYQDKPTWAMMYYGRVIPGEFKPRALYGFLRKALQHPPSDKPYRGPEIYQQNQWEYRNHVHGDVDNFNGHETIYQGHRLVYWASYLGGLVDQRARGEM